MTKSSIIYVLIFSLILNAAVVCSAAIVWWKRPAQASDSPLKSVQQFIKEDLKLESAKSDELVNKIKIDRDEIYRLRSEIQSLRSELIETITAEKPDPSAVENKMSHMDRLQFQIRRTGIGILSQIAQSLGPEDRKKFGTYLKERMTGCGPLGGRGPFGEFTGGR